MLIGIEDDDVRSYLRRSGFFAAISDVATIDPPVPASDFDEVLRGSSPMLIEVTRIENGKALPALLDRIVLVLRDQLNYQKFDSFDVATVISEACQNTFDHNIHTDVPPILSSTSVESPIIRKGRSDVKKRFTEAQIIGFLREAEAGLPVKDLCRRHGFSEASYYLWRSKFGGMTVSDAKRLKELETENGRLKKLLAESQLEIEVTREVLQKKW